MRMRKMASRRRGRYFIVGRDEIMTAVISETRRKAGISNWVCCVGLYHRVRIEVRSCDQQKRVSKNAALRRLALHQVRKKQKATTHNDEEVTTLVYILAVDILLRLVSETLLIV